MADVVLRGLLAWLAARLGDYGTPSPALPAKGREHAPRECRMADIVLRVAGLKVAYGGLRAARSALMGDSWTPSPALPREGEGARAAGVPHG